MHQTHIPPVLAAHLDQSLLGGADRGIGRLVGHRGAGEELRSEVLHRDRVVVAHDFLRPLAAVSCRCRAILAYVFARHRFASRYPFDAACPFAGLRRAIIRS
ncbi:hypothetical protein GCM10023238_15130 [Streptomyces heliomycini]